MPGIYAENGTPMGPFGNPSQSIPLSKLAISATFEHGTFAWAGGGLVVFAASGGTFAWTGRASVALAVGAESLRSTRASSVNVDQSISSSHCMDSAGGV